MASEWKPGLQGVGAVAFKTMVALYVEVEPIHWERGRPCLCNAVLMTGIHGRCQVQVEMWMLVGGRDGFLRLYTTPGGLIQFITVVWEVGGLDPLFCKGNLLAPIPNTIP